MYPLPFRLAPAYPLATGAVGKRKRERERERERERDIRRIRFGEGKAFLPPEEAVFLRFWR
jgi:hypothetical protein